MITPREFWALCKERPFRTLTYLAIGGCIGWIVSHCF